MPKSIKTERKAYVAPCIYRAQYFDHQKNNTMIRKLKTGQYRIYSRKIDPKTRKRKNLGTFDSLDAAQKHEREIQYFKHH
jgi:hypothetical protein